MEGEGEVSGRSSVWVKSLGLGQGIFLLSLFGLGEIPWSEAWDSSTEPNLLEDNYSKWN